MNKKLVLLLTAMIVLVSIGAYMLVGGTDSPSAKEEAIRQAQEYRPKGLCTTAEVPAIHLETGAEYTFSSGCLAPGWEPKR